MKYLCRIGYNIKSIITNFYTYYRNGVFCNEDDDDDEGIMFYLKFVYYDTGLSFLNYSHNISEYYAGQTYITGLYEVQLTYLIALAIY